MLAVTDCIFHYHLYINRTGFTIKGAVLDQHAILLHLL